MLTPEEIQHIIDYEIIVDAYDEYEMSSGWYETMNDRLNFPFEATATLTKKAAVPRPGASRWWDCTAIRTTLWAMTFS